MMNGTSGTATQRLQLTQFHQTQCGSYQLSCASVGTGGRLARMSEDHNAESSFRRIFLGRLTDAGRAGDWARPPALGTTEAPRTFCAYAGQFVNEGGLRRLQPGAMSSSFARFVGAVMDTYKFGSITGLGADGDHPDKGRLDRVRDYRDVFNPPDTGKWSNAAYMPNPSS